MENDPGKKIPEHLPDEKIKKKALSIQEDTGKKTSPKKSPPPLLRFIADNWHLIFLVLLLIFFTIHTAVFISRDRSPIVSDSHTHLMFARDSYNSVGNVKKFGELGYLNKDYPPLVYLVTGVFFKIFGLSLTTAIWSIYPFSIIFILSLFFTGFHFGGKSGAVATALIGTSNIFFINYSHLYMLDVPHAALTCLAMCFLFKSEMFKKPLYSYLFGLTFGLSLLCRFSSMFFIAGPLIVLFVYFAFHSLRVFIFTIPFALGINGMLFYFLKFALDNRQNLELIRSRYGLNMIIFLVIGAILILLTILIRKKMMGLFQRKNHGIVEQVITGTRAILLSLIIAMSIYLYIMHMLMFRFAEHIYDLEIELNSMMNYHTLNNFFPMIFIMTGIGIIFIFIRRKRILDFIVLISMGVSGFLFTTYLAAPFSRYLIALALVFSVLGGYWIEYIGKLKFPALAYIFAYSALSLGFLFFSPAVPQKIQEINLLETRKTFYTDPVYPTNPDPDSARLFAIADDIENEFNRSLRGKYKKMSVYYHYRKEFISDPADQGEIQGTFLRDTYGLNLYRVLQYKNLPLEHEHGKITKEEFLKINRSIPVFLLIGYVDGDYPRKVIKRIEMEDGRKIRRISGYCVIGKKKVNVYLIFPADSK